MLLKGADLQKHLQHLPSGYLVYSGGILKIPSGEQICEFPKDMGAYVGAHTVNGVDWMLYRFHNDRIYVYRWMKLSVLELINQIDISNIYIHTGQFFGYQLDISGTVMALPSDNNQGYFFLILNDRMRHFRNFRYTRPSNQIYHFWALLNNKLIKYDAKNDRIIEKHIIYYNLNYRMNRLDISPDGRYVVGIRLSQPGIAGIKNATYLMDVYDLESGHLRSFQVPGMGMVEQVLILDNHFALVVFGLPLLGKWEIRAVNIITGQSWILKKYHSYKQAYRYIQINE